MPIVENPQKSVSLRPNKDKIPSVAFIDRPLPEGFIAEPAPSKENTINKVKASTSMSSVEPVTSQLPDGDGWVRQGFPSKSLIYRVKDTFVRPLEVRTLKRLTAAVSEKSFTFMLDALNDRISMDIRDLTVPDFYFFLYWLRINSYPRSPLTINWTSKYGNENVTRVTLSSFEIIELEMTKHELSTYQDLGITIPTVRDMEILSDPDINKLDKWEIEYAQYMYLENITDSYLKDKLDKFNELGLDAMTLINEFSDKIQHGIIEKVEVQDSKFDLDEALNYLKKEQEALGRIVNQLLESNEPDSVPAVTGITQHIEDRVNLIAYLEKCKEDGSVPVVDKEEVALGTADATILFL